MAKFRKKPVVIEATQWFKHGDHPAVTIMPRGHESPNKGWVHTLEGGHEVTPGDWIITGVKGEHYPCKPDIFEMTYDKMVDGADESIEFQSISHQLDWYKNMCAKYAEDRLNEGKRLQDTMATVNELMTKIFELKSELSKYKPDMGNSYNEG